MSRATGGGTRRRSSGSAWPSLASTRASTLSVLAPTPITFAKCFARFGFIRDSGSRAASARSMARWWDPVDSYTTHRTPGRTQAPSSRMPSRVFGNRAERPPGSSCASRCFFETSTPTTRKSWPSAPCSRLGVFFFDMLSSLLSLFAVLIRVSDPGLVGKAVGPIYVSHLVQGASRACHRLPAAPRGVADSII